MNLKSQFPWIILAVALIFAVSFISGRHSSASINRIESDEEFHSTANTLDVKGEEFYAFLDIKGRRSLIPYSKWIVTDEKIDKWFLTTEKRPIIVSYIKETKELEIRDENGSWRETIRPAVPPS